MEKETENESLAIKTAKEVMERKKKEQKEKQSEEEKEKQEKQKTLEFLEELDKLREKSGKSYRFIFADNSIITIQTDKKIADRVDTNLFSEGKKFNLLIKLGERTRIDGLNSYYSAVTLLIKQEITDIELFDAI